VLTTKGGLEGHAVVAISDDEHEGVAFKALRGWPSRCQGAALEHITSLSLMDIVLFIQVKY